MAEQRPERRTQDKWHLVRDIPVALIISFILTVLLQSLVAVYYFSAFKTSTQKDIAEIKTEITNLQEQYTGVGSMHAELTMFRTAVDRLNTTAVSLQTTLQKMHDTQLQQGFQIQQLQQHYRDSQNSRSAQHGP